ncbi:unnamed protein product [Caenorhabditis bovis]|uniref:C-type lectin domain-containing protein n=1 Tax=Caenorhabditis bovis TaxID=2654633 RepID=A0A8S1ECI5_9PELO|nr:unnamed protein product [Caenorhabditis bovis]
MLAILLIVGIISIGIEGKLDLKNIKRQQTYPPGNIPTTMSSAAGDLCNAGCPEGWIPFNRKCYRNVEKKLSQKDAEAECQTEGSHLVSLLSAEEARAAKFLIMDSPFFVTSLSSFTSSSADIWIGLSKSKNGSWFWTDSNKVEFTNFPSGASSSSESCSQITNGASAVWQPIDSEEERTRGNVRQLVSVQTKCSSSDDSARLVADTLPNWAR